MTNKLKCPFCKTELEQGIELLRGGHILGCPKCKRNADDIFWFALIQTKQDLEFFIKEQFRNVSALIERTKELDKCQKDLEIARNALKDIVFCKQFDSVIAVRKYADKALEQIEHKE